LDSEEFTARKGCSVLTPTATLLVGNSLIVSGPVLDYAPTGHSFEATVKLCSDPAQAGLCDTQTINFTLP
jgi:hypothetical protein